MRGSQPGRTQYTVACACGAKHTLDARGFGKPRRCPSCQGTVTVAWGRDERTGRPAPVSVTKGGKAAAKSGGGLTLQKSERPKPSAPLVPLHLRPPVRHRIKPGAGFVECPCGERLLLRSGIIGRAMQCPACDRFHQIEAESASAPPAVGPAPAAPGAPAPTRPLKLGEFACKCGEIQPPRTSRTGKGFECAKCGRKGHVEASPDPITGLPAMKPVFTHEPEAAKAASGPAWTCDCGSPLPAADVLAKRTQSCPACGRAIRLEQTRDARSPKTLIRPVFEAPAPAPPPAPEAAVAFEELEPLDAPTSIPEDAPTAACSCGAELFLTDDLVGQTVQCPACSDLLAVERGLDGRGLRLRTVGSVAEPGEWTLDEFR